MDKVESSVSGIATGFGHILGLNGDPFAEQNAILTQQQNAAAMASTAASQKLASDLTMQYFRQFGRSGTSAGSI